MGLIRKGFVLALTILWLLSSWLPAGAYEVNAPAALVASNDNVAPAIAKIVVYINWDGFAKYYIDLAEAQGKIPTLSWIKGAEGVFFANAYTGIPAITNPMQAAIASGTTPRFTDNHYRYFDKKLNKVVQELPVRKNRAETLAEAAVRQGVNTLSINQFAFFQRGTSIGQPTKLYINAPVGANGYSDYSARFDAAIQILKKMEEDGLPATGKQLLIALYMDDLDALGHNMEAVYGQAPVRTEAERRQAVVDRLALMDAKLGELIQVCREVGLYDRMSFLLTTDHGMAPMGLQESDFDDSIYSKLPDLLSTIEALGPDYQCAVLKPGDQEKPPPEAGIAVVTVGLQAQLSHIGQFDPGVIAEKNTKIAAALQKKGYIDRIMFPWEMIGRGVKPGFADLIISPQPPYHFRTASRGATTARGQHDSLAVEAQQIATFMWGNGIKKGLTYRAKVYNHDLAPTLAYLLGINAPLDATGQIIHQVLVGIDSSGDKEVKIEDQAAILNRTVRHRQDKEASGSAATNLPDKYAAFELSAVPAAKRILVRYAAAGDSRLYFFVNGRFIRTLFFPATSGLASKYDEKRINYTLRQGDSIRFVVETTEEDGISIDYLLFR